jgi:hypothetical protein
MLRAKDLSEGRRRMPKKTTTKLIRNPFIAKVIKLKNPKPEPRSVHLQSLKALAERMERDKVPAFSNKTMTFEYAQKKMKAPKRDKQSGRSTKRNND